MSNESGTPGGQSWPGSPQPQSPYQGAFGAPSQPGQPPQAQQPGQMPGMQAPPAWGGYPQPPGGQMPYGMPYGAPNGASSGGGLSGLFDFSFNSFVTPTVTKIIYAVGMVLIGLFYLGSVINGFMLAGAAGGIGALLVGGLVAFFMLLILRVSLEFNYAMVRMSEDIHKDKESK